jgi:hypothetical protein
MMNKYVEELVTEMLFDVSDIALGHSYQYVGYDSKKEFFAEMQRKLQELEYRLTKKD